MTNTVHDSFQQFVEAVVLPRMQENPGHERLDGWQESKGNWEVAGRFRFEGSAAPLPLPGRVAPRVC